MSANKSNGGYYEVLSPWAEVEPVPLRGISPRLTDLAGKKIGLFFNNKRAARPITDVVEQRLKERFANIEFSRFERVPNVSVAETEDKAKFDEWVKGSDAVIASVGD
jgi:hypothetical protein